jgi:hypothetical protein
LIQRGVLLLGLIVLIGFYQWAYVNWLYPIFGYYGFAYTAPPTGYLILAWILSLTPSLWMPLKIARPSQLAYWVLYLTVVIPSMFVPLFVRLNAPSEVARLMVTLIIGFAICGCGYLFPLRFFRTKVLSAPVFWFAFILLAAICTAWIVVAFRGNIHLVSFIDIYDLRDESQSVMEGTLLNYPLMWLYGAINPFLVAWGLHYKRWMAFLVGAAGQVIVYSTLGTKASLLSIMFILGLYLLLRKDRIALALKLIWSIAALFAVLCLSFEYVGKDPGLILFGFLFLVFFRSFGLAGLLTAQYYYFIQNNPITYYSHIKGVSLFVHYPFQYPLGTQVGYYYYFPLVDATAHFWATDGLAALRLPGIIIASLACAIVFWLLDSVGQRLDMKFVALTTFYATYSLANLSLFTTFLSGGLGLLLVFLYWMPKPSFAGAAVVANNSAPDFISSPPTRIGPIGG